MTGSLVDANTEVATSVADLVGDVTAGSVTNLGSVGEQIGTIPGSIEVLSGSAANPLGSVGPTALGSLVSSVTAGPETAGSVEKALEGGSLTDVLLDLGSLEAGDTGSLGVVPAGSLEVLFDVLGAGSVADATNVTSATLAVSSLGVSEGSLVGILPVLSVAGAVAGGAALAGGIQLPALPAIELPAIPGLPAGSAAPVQAAPAAQQAGAEQPAKARG